MKPLIKSMSKKYPNDADLGKAVREMINILEKDESDNRKKAESMPGNERIKLRIDFEKETGYGTEIPSFINEPVVFTESYVRYLEDKIFACSQKVSKEKQIEKEVIELRNEISQEHSKKIRSYLPEVQMFYLHCEDLDLDKEYSVAGFESKFKGIDLLAMMDIVMREKKDPTNGLFIKGGLYFDKKNKCVGYVSASGPNLFI
jgi:hypothetical protein